MNRFFRQRKGLADYVAIAVFAVAYGAALALVLAPNLLLR
jgi:hypothetical protein